MLIGLPDNATATTSTPPISFKSSLAASPNIFTKKSSPCDFRMERKNVVVSSTGGRSAVKMDKFNAALLVVSFVFVQFAKFPPAVHIFAFSSYESLQSGEPSHKYFIGMQSPCGH